MNPASDVFGWAILIATFVGPVAAVLVTRWVDGRRERKDRQMRIFRALMSNRTAGLNGETIQSLNLIEIDFYDRPEVISAWKSYFQSLCAEAPVDISRAQAFGERRYRLLVSLLDSIAKSLGYKFEQLSILEGGYYPTGAAKIEAEQASIRDLFAGIAEGRRVLPIAVTNLPDQLDGDKSIK